MKGRPEGTPSREAPRHFFDLVMVAPNGVFLCGWIDDIADPLRGIEILFPDRKVRFEADRIGRCRRRDVETALGSARAESFGLYTFGALERPTASRGACQVHASFRSGLELRGEAAPRYVDDVELRDVALAHLHGMDFCGNAAVETFQLLDRGIGDELIAHNRRVSSALARSASTEAFGATAPGRCRASVVVCLYGKPEFLFLQNALFGTPQDATDLEFIYVCNSPELLEVLYREAAISRRIYGTRQSIVALAGNAGFGAANNAAASVARSDRLMFVNPDVFPMQRDWAERHAAVVEGAPVASTRLFGVPLLYADGSLMHGGMYCEAETGISVGEGAVRRRSMLRIEHFGKGAPSGFEPLLESRPVPAVSGAFISADRAHFEALGGFSEDYMLGHYEDADLCFRSIGRGVVPWLHNLPYWHLEGRGGRRQATHEGAMTVNRWHFSRTWQREVAEGLGGRTPSRLAAALEGPLKNAAGKVRPRRRTA